jgi:hypothetical protein
MENIEFKNIFVSKYQATSKTNKLYKQKKMYTKFNYNRIRIILF